MSEISGKGFAWVAVSHEELDKLFARRGKATCEVVAVALLWIIGREASGATERGWAGGFIWTGPGSAGKSFGVFESLCLGHSENDYTMTCRTYYVALAAIVTFAILGNLALLSRYNIYVGDDGYLASYLYEYHFTGNRSFVLCGDWPIHQFLVATLGAVYRWIYHAHLTLLEMVGASYYRINALSAILFLVTFVAYLATVLRLQGRWVVVACAIVFGTLEPFLVMSHSVRTESVILFALAVGIYSLTRNRADVLTLGLLFFTGFAIINTHLGGWPLLVGLSAGVYYIFGLRVLLLYSVECAVAFVAYLLLNDLDSPQALTQLVETYRRQGSVSSYTRGHVLNDLARYFLEAKYKRHLIELLIVAGFLLPALQWRRLSQVARGLLLTTIVAFLAYVVLFSYINYYYLVYFYYLMLVSIAWSGSELLRDRSGGVLTSLVVMPFVVLYASIFVMFIRSPGWDAIIARQDVILRHLPPDGVIAAPEYFVNIDPRHHRFFVPLAQANEESGCVALLPDPRELDALIVDTRQKGLAGPYLDRFTLVERIRIGRLATQSLSDEGDLFVYVRTPSNR